MLFFGASQQNNHAENNVSEHPECHQHSYAHSGTDSHACKLCIRFGCILQFANVGGIAEEPQDHQNIEGNKQEFDNFSKGPALWFFKFRAAFRAIKGLIGDLFAAFSAVDKRHIVTLLVAGFPAISRTARNISSFLVCPAKYMPRSPRGAGNRGREAGVRIVFHTSLLDLGRALAVRPLFSEDCS